MDPDFVPLIIEDEFDKETSDAIELGWKSRLADGRISFDGAAYYTSVDDLQIFEFLVGPFGLLRVVSNIDEVEITGLELGVSAAVTETFTLGASIDARDTEIKANASRPYTVGNKAPYSPDWTAPTLPLRSMCRFAIAWTSLPTFTCAALAQPGSTRGRTTPGRRCSNLPQVLPAWEQQTIP